MSEQIRIIKEGMYSKIYFALTLIFAIFISLFAKALNWIWVLIFIDLLLIILVWFAKNFYIERREHVIISRTIINDLKKLGVNIKN